MVESTKVIQKKYHLNTTFGDISKDERAASFLEPLYAACTMLESCDTNSEESGLGSSSKAMQEAMMQYMPLRAMVSFQNGTIDFDELQKVIDKINQ